MINRVLSESLILALAQQVAVAVVAGLKKKEFHSQSEEAANVLLPTWTTNVLGIIGLSTSLSHF